MLVDLHPDMSVMEDETFRSRRHRDPGERRGRGDSPRQRQPLRTLRLGLRPRGRAREGGPAIKPARSTSTTSSSTCWRRACRWAAGRSQGSATATASTGSASTAVPGDRFRPHLLRSEPLWYPYTPGRHALVSKVTKFIGGRGLRRFRWSLRNPLVTHARRLRRPVPGISRYDLLPR